MFRKICHSQTESVKDFLSTHYGGGLVCSILNVAAERMLEESITSQYAFTTEDQRFIDGAETPEMKTLRTSIVIASIELNGAYANALPGMAVSYIPKSNYYHKVKIDNSNVKITEILEQALNWEALGKGLGGLAGASVRWKLRNQFEESRETIVISKFETRYSALIKEYAAYVARNAETSGVWYANSWNVVGLSASCFIKECHHWDAANTKPIKALLGSLSQENIITESEYRKLFYLSIHPLPLKYLAVAVAKSRDPEDRDISETVRMRLRVAPAGYADLCACAIAAQSFMLEDYGKKSKVAIDIARLMYAADKIKTNAVQYHPFATQMGFDHKEFQKTPYQEAMIVLTAYAKYMIGGTLAASPALNKFANQHDRKIQKLGRAFKEYADKKSEDLILLLTGSQDNDLDTLRDRITPLAKLADRLKGLATSNDSPLYAAAKAVEIKITELTANLDRPNKPDVLLPTDEQLALQIPFDRLNFHEKARVISGVRTKKAKIRKERVKRAVGVGENDLRQQVIIYDDGSELFHVALPNNETKVIEQREFVPETMKLIPTTPDDLAKLNLVVEDEVEEDVITSEDETEV